MWVNVSMYLEHKYTLALCASSSEGVIWKHCVDVWVHMQTLPYTASTGNMKQIDVPS